MSNEGGDTQAEYFRGIMGTDVTVKKCGREFAISKPIVLPEKAKDQLFAWTREKFANAFPEIDFDSIEPSTLKNIAIQALIPPEGATTSEIATGEFNKSSKGVAFLEALTDVVARYVTFEVLGQRLTPSMLHSVGSREYTQSISRIQYALFRWLSEHYIDEYYLLRREPRPAEPEGFVSLYSSEPTYTDLQDFVVKKYCRVVGKALFSADFRELERIYNERNTVDGVEDPFSLMRHAPLFSKYDIEDFGESVSKKGSILKYLMTAGGYSKSRGMLFSIPHAALGFLLLELPAAVRYKFRNSLRLSARDTEESLLNSRSSVVDYFHEFTHLFTFKKWEGLAR